MDEQDLQDACDLAHRMIESSIARKEEADVNILDVRKGFLAGEIDEERYAVSRRLHASILEREQQSRHGTIMNLAASIVTVLQAEYETPPIEPQSPDDVPFLLNAFYGKGEEPNEAKVYDIRDLRSDDHE